MTGRGWVPALVIVAAMSLAGVARAATAPKSSTQRFEEAAPRVGESMPDLTLYDDAGRLVSLRDVLRDHYTVVVLGCLT
ncbi:MAG: hypothetical protein ACE5HU_06025 [Acidobacteriota bacterium]